MGARRAAWPAVAILVAVLALIPAADPVDRAHAEVPSAPVNAASPAFYAPSAPEPTVATYLPAGQETNLLEGQVLLGTDSLPVAGLQVVLHRVTAEGGARVDSAETRESGRFSFPLPEVDGGEDATVYIVSADYEGTLYFGPALHGRQPAEPYRVMVYPTRNVESPAAVAAGARTVLVSREGAGWRALDIVDMENDGGHTLTADPGGWAVVLPDGVREARVLPGGVPVDDVSFRQGRAHVDTPLPPGGWRLVMEYRLPEEGVTAITPLRPVRRLEVIRPEGEGGVDLPGATVETLELEGSRYERYTARDVEAGVSIGLGLHDEAVGDGRTLGWLLLAVGFLLGAGAVLAWRRNASAGLTSPVALAVMVAGGAMLAPSTAMASAHPASPAPDTVTVRDDLDRVVRFQEPPRRIVSLVPTMTEIFFSLEAGDRVVARTRYADWPPEVREVPSVGEGVRPSLEAILARDPDVVVLYAGPDNRGTVRQLQRLEIPTVAVRNDRFEDLFENIRRLGALTGEEAGARTLEERVRCELEHAARAVEGREPVRVYYEVWSDPPITVGRGSFLDSLVRIAGGENVFGDLEAPSPRVSLEAIVSREPELIVMPERGEADRTPPERRPGWRGLEAVREGNVRTVDGDLVHRLGPRIGEAARALAGAIHPGAAGEDGDDDSPDVSPCEPGAGPAPDGG